MRGYRPRAAHLEETNVQPGPGRGAPGWLVRAAFSSGAQLLLVSARDDRRAFDRTAGVDRPRQPHELAVRPGERCGGARALPRLLAGRRLVVPDLLGQHQAVI